jgi:hypothetical protein
MNLKLAALSLLSLEATAFMSNSKAGSPSSAFVRRRGEALEPLGVSFVKPATLEAPAKPKKWLPPSAKRKWRRRNQKQAPTNSGEEKIAHLFELWNDALATGDSRLVAACCASDAVLLPCPSVV